MLVIAGCVKEKPESIKSFDTDMLNKMYFLPLCKNYHTLNKNDQFTTLSRSQFETTLKNKGLSKKDLDIAKQNEIYIGMSQCGLYVSWGNPSDEHTSVNKYTKRIQHVYGTNINNISYVYTENGKVTSWQQ